MGSLGYFLEILFGVAGKAPPEMSGATDSRLDFSHKWDYYFGSKGWSVTLMLFECNMSDLWPWDSHVHFRADGHTGDLLVVSAENLHRPRRQAAGETTLKDKRRRRFRTWIPNFNIIPHTCTHRDTRAEVYLLQDLPHDTGGVSWTRDEVDATEVESQASHYVFVEETKNIQIYRQTWNRVCAF